MQEPLIPDDVRRLYEQLIDDDGLLIRSDDPRWNDPDIARVLSSGLAAVMPRTPPLLSPVGPDAAFARLLLHWQHTMEDLREQFGVVQLQANKLQQVTIRAVASRRPSYRCGVISGGYNVSALRDTLARTGEQCVRSFATGPYAEALTLPTGEPHPLASSYAAPPRELLSHGGRYRLVADQATVDGDIQGNLARGQADGEEIRIIPQKLPMKLLVVDDHTALVPLGPYGHPCLLLRDPTLVTAFISFFELFWAQGTPFAPGGPAAAQEKDNLPRQRILDALVAGLKDEAIARQLGLSVRTVRRHITTLMHELGVANRFAAGVAAVRRGLVPRAA